MLRLLLAVVLITGAAWADDTPKRVEPDVANQNLVKKVDPVVPPIAALAGVGGTVVLDVTISTDGRVSAAKFLSGPLLLQGACIEAAKQREYKPFLENGQAIVVVTKMECNTPAPTRTKSEEKALQDYYPAEQVCEGLVRAKQYADAEKKCAEALALSDQLPPERLLERSGSRTLLAHSLLGEGKTKDAIPLYEKALEISRGVEKSDQDADFATDHVNLARAYYMTGQFDKADPLYARSIQIFQAAIVALPVMKDNYTPRMARALLEYAQLKAARGDAEGAKALQQKAAALR